MNAAVARSLRWVRGHDPGLSALRRAARAAIVMPAMFALGVKVIANPDVALFAAFGSFALLLLVDFTGPMRDRLLAQAALALTGAVFVSVATLASRSTWIAALAMAAVGFAVLFAGVVSSVLAGAALSLLIAFILPVALAATVSSIPDRLEGWGLASAASLLAVSLLWPAPTRDPLRFAAAAACLALAERLVAGVAFMLGDGTTAAERDSAAAKASSSVAALQRLFYATPYRPTGLSTSARAIVRLVDEIGWLEAILGTPSASTELPPGRAACAVKSASAAVLQAAAEVLENPGQDPAQLLSGATKLRAALLELEANVTIELEPQTGAGSEAADIVSALDPSFRAQELTFAVSQIALNVELAALAERRSWLDRALGRQPAGLSPTLAAAQERAAGHFGRHSVWLHNSLRGAAGLGIAVAVARGAGVQHTFWVVLGTFSVLRSNALNTGQNAVRGLLGTVAGVIFGALLLSAIGTDTTLLWFLLPVAILFAGFAPAAISFAAGQAAFTLAIVILFNILQPLGWRVGLIRIEDVALGCGVSLGVGLLLWPRGAAAALGHALADAYAESARYLTAAVEFGLGRCDDCNPTRPSPAEEAGDAAAAARRLDDAFRTYLAERSAKPVPLAEAASLVTGVAGLRLAAEAVIDLWGRDSGPPEGDRADASRELLTMSGAISGWFEGFAASLAGGREVPGPLGAADVPDDGLVDAVRHDLADADGRANDVAVRIIWTGDHLDAARRLQARLVEPAGVLGKAVRDAFAVDNLRRSLTSRRRGPVPSP